VNSSKSCMRILGWPAWSTHNPYICLLYQAVAELGVRVEEFSPKVAFRSKHEVIHLHWAEQIFWGAAPPAASASYASKILVSLVAAKARGTAIVWTVHNLSPHEMQSGQRRIWKAFSTCLAWLSDGFITLSPSTIPLVRNAYAGLRHKPGRSILHGHYIDSYPRSLPRQIAREQLCISPEARVFVHAGFLRAYKGIEALISAFRELKAPDAMLLLAGEAQPGQFGQKLKALCSQDSRIRLHLGFQTPEQMVRILSCGDLTVMPCEKSLHSGSALLALSVSRPVLARTSPYFSDLQAVVGTDWLMHSDTKLDANLLSRGLDWAEASERAPDPDLTACSWEVGGTKTLAFYQELLAKRRSVGSYPVQYRS
jgi:beta-1,4-mannosyltransferase